MIIWTWSGITQYPYTFMAEPMECTRKTSTAAEAISGLAKTGSRFRTATVTEQMAPGRL